MIFLSHLTICKWLIFIKSIGTCLYLYVFLQLNYLNIFLLFMNYS